MSADQKTRSEDQKKIWDARIAALTTILGEPNSTVFHSPTPMYLGGFADVMAFPNYVSGITYVTADLTGEDCGQLPNSSGNYELMICVREELASAPDLISRLARYTCDAVLEPGATMDLPGFFEGSVIEALLFANLDEKPVQFSFLGRPYGLLLCIGISAKELAFKRAKGSDALVALLKQRKVFPYTVPQRESVTP